MRRHRRRGRLVSMAAAVATAAVLSGVLAETASAYIRVYFFGTPSSPVLVSPGTTAGSQTSDHAFHLFVEATATRLDIFEPMSTVRLTYNGAQIGVSYFDDYFVKYQNGPNTRAGCVITMNPGGRQSYDYCDAAR